MTQDIQWQVKTFNELTTNELYDALKLRVDVFVVEQTCYYPELDDLDRHPDTLHLYSYQDDVMTSYLRILPKGTTYPDYVAIGRVVIAPGARGKGLGHQLMSKAIAACQKHFPGQSIKMSAQEHLEAFYNQHGFNRVSDMYLEDNIPHIAMLKEV